MHAATVFHSTMEPEFMSDALDDLRDFYAPTPAPAPPVPSLAGITVAAKMRADFLRGMTMVTADPDFLSVVAPDLYLARGTMVAAFHRGMQAATAATEESARGVRHLGHVCGLPSVESMR